MRLTSFTSPLFSALRVAFAFLCLWAVPSLHALIAYDNTTYTYVNSSATATLAHTPSTGSGTYRVLVVGIMIEHTTPASMPITAITYNGNAMTAITGAQSDFNSGGGYITSYLYYILDSGMGTATSHDVSVTFTGSVNGIQLTATSLNGVKQQAPEASANSSSATSPISTNITTISNNAWVVDVIGTSGSNTTFGATGTNMTVRTTNIGTNNSAASATRPVGAAGTVTESWTASSASSRISHSLAAFAAQDTTMNISGTVFEDTGYSGGVGRSNATASGTARSSARVELFDASGNYLSATTTDGSGNYSLSGYIVTSYTVRVVNSTVTSSLGGTSLLPVQTFRTSVSSGTVTAVTDRVGGETPSLADAGNGSTTLAALTAGSLTPQSISAVSTGVVLQTGVDFGFNFATIVNVNDTGQGSLRQFITNANGMSGTQTSVFMLSDGSADPGIRTGLTSQLTSGVGVITVASALPQITGTIVLDGTSQTTNVGNTNSGSLGTGGTVGVDAVTLSTVSRPEIEIVGSSSYTLGLDIAAASTTIKGISIHGFGTLYTNGDINIGAVSSVTINQCVVGTSATSFTRPGATPTGGAGIVIGTGGSGTISNSLVGFANYSGIRFGSDTASGWTLSNCEVRGNAVSDAIRAGVALRGASHALSGLLITANKGPGIDFITSGAASGSVTNCTVTSNGVGTTVSSGSPQTAGIRINGLNDTIDRCLVASNYGAGVFIQSGATGNKITRCSLYSNGTILNDASAAATGQIGIDLLSSSDNTSTGTAPYYTINDSSDSDSGGNNLLNAPVINTAVIASGTLTITGWAQPSSVIEFYISDSDASGFGEGMTYVASITEGSGSDADATTGSYSNPVNGLNQGSDTTNKFTYVLAVPGGVSAGVKLTATATDGSNNTSEFSGVVTVTGTGTSPSFTLTKTKALISDPINLTTNPKAIPGSFLDYTIEIVNTSAGSSDSGTFIFTDQIPSGISLYVADLNGASSGPVVFTDGSVSSALSYTFTSLSNGADSLSFSNDNGSTWTYTPTADVNGCDANVTTIRVIPSGIFAGAIGGNNPSCTLRFRGQVK